MSPFVPQSEKPSGTTEALVAVIAQIAESQKRDTEVKEKGRQPRF